MQHAVKPALVLASASPRRKELLHGLGLTFEIAHPDIDETPLLGESPEAMVLRLARRKAAAVAATRSDALVLAADTTVVVDGQNLGKPRDRSESVQFLERLQGRTHWVHTGHALRLGEREASRVRSTRVNVRSLSAQEMERYAASGEGMDKAGGYAIQGLGATLVDGIDGCYGAVVGLSLPTVVTLARELGVDLV